MATAQACYFGADAVSKINVMLRVDSNHSTNSAHLHFIQLLIVAAGKQNKSFARSELNDKHNVSEHDTVTSPSLRFAGAGFFQKE